jgi:hypothetical protein
VTPLRFEVLTKLELARERVARGAPTLHAAFHYLRLSYPATVEVHKAMADVKAAVPAAELEQAAQSKGVHHAEGLRLRDQLATAWRNRHIPWESPEGLSRAQSISLLFIDWEFLKSLPVTSAGPLLPSLGLSRPTTTTTQNPPEGEDGHG